jgi:hypothetical protein
MEGRARRDDAPGMQADARARGGRTGYQLLLADIRRVHELQRQRPTSARDRVEDALGVELARRLLGALAPRGPRPARRVGLRGLGEPASVLPGRQDLLAQVLGAAQADEEEDRAGGDDGEDER